MFLIMALLAVDKCPVHALKSYFPESFLYYVSVAVLYVEKKNTLKLKRLNFKLKR